FPALGLLITNACSGLFGALSHRELGDVEIDVAPSQCCDLTAAQAAENSQDDGDRHARASRGADQVRSLSEVVSLHGAALDLGRIDGIGRIARQHLPSHRLVHGSLQSDVHVSHRAWGKTAPAIPAAGGKRLGVSIGYLHRPQFGEDYGTEKGIDVLSHNLAVPLVRFGGDPRLHVLHPRVEKLRHRDPRRFDVRPAANFRNETRAFDLSRAFRSVERMPFAPALASLWIAHIKYNRPMAGG